MKRRAKGVYEHRTASRSACVVLVCRDEGESDRMVGLMTDAGPFVLVTYRKVEDLAMNAPREGASLVILDDDFSPEQAERSLRWLKRWQPSATVALIGRPECPELEMTARMAGASYFVRPVAEMEWRAMLAHVMVMRTKSSSPTGATQ